jgi:hypothetical protein
VSAKNLGTAIMLLMLGVFVTRMWPRAMAVYRGAPPPVPTECLEDCEITGILPIANGGPGQCLMFNGKSQLSWATCESR